MKMAFTPTFVQSLELVVDLDERGSFRGHVDDQLGQTVFEFSNEDAETGWPDPDGLWLIESGYVNHPGLKAGAWSRKTTS